MSNQTNTGWSNKQTWNINLMYEEMFANMVEEQTFDDVEHLADAMEQIVNELEFDGLRSCSLAHEAVGAYLEAVDWQELAEHFYEEEEVDEEVERLNSCSLIAE